MPWAYTLHLPRDPRAVGVARRTLRAVLGGYGLRELADTAELLASELVTNAQRHTGGASLMRLSGVEGERVRVGVWDTDPVVPPPFDRPQRRGGEGRGGGQRGGSAPFDPGGEGGRGLLLVRTWADRWGGYALGEAPFGAGGKLLWFELAAQQEKEGRDGGLPAG
ncbi:ATP-binding protein [Streptomyces thermolineatus]|uniref:ATP-binding protein n=1 Tax=Streptomyces thermolineatus TaxID=44033 RepID=UPI0031D5CE3F